MSSYRLQEVLEWVIAGLVVVLLALIAFWLGGWLFLLLGKLLLALSKLLGNLLYFLIPALVVAGVVYLVVSWIQKEPKEG